MREPIHPNEGVCIEKSIQAGPTGKIMGIPGWFGQVTR